MARLKFKVSVPPIELSPNNRSHWRTKSSLGKIERLHCSLVASECLYNLNSSHELFGFDKWDYDRKCVVHHRWNYGKLATEKCHRYKPRDEQNAVASLKHTFDGFTDAGIIHDDSSKYLKLGDYSVTHDGDHTYIEITIEQI